MSVDTDGGRRDTHLIHYWQVLRNRKWVVFGFAVALMATTLIGSLVATRYYRAAAVLQIDTKAPVVFDVGSVSESAPTTPWGPQVKAYYMTQYRIMGSRPVMEEAVRRLREEHGVDDFDAVANPQAYLRSFVEIVPDPETQLVRVVVEYPDSEKAALFANTVAKSYLDGKKERSLEDTTEALGWLSEQLEVYRSRKVTTDEEVHRFRFEHALIGNQQGTHITMRSLEEIQTAWSDIHTRRVKAQAAYQGLLELTQARGLMTVATHLASSDPILGGMLARHQELKQERSRLTSRYTSRHPEVVQVDTEIQGLEQTLRDKIDTIVESHEARVDLLIREEEVIQDELEKAQAGVEELGETLITLELLSSEADRNAQFYRDLDTRLTEVGISQFIQSSNVRMVEEAIPLPQPVRPRVLANLLTAALLGLIGGAVLALIVEYFDLNIKTREDIEEFLGIPFLGVVPKVGADQLAALSSPLGQSLLVAALPRSAVAESLRTIRTHALFRLPKGKNARVLVTSTAPQEGKSFISANLAAIVAMGGSKVLLVDGDMRRPTLHKLLKLANDRGLANVLQGEVRLAEVIHETDVPGMHLVPAGKHEHATDIDNLDVLEQALHSVSDYDLVVIDSPPTSAVADASAFASLVDGLLYVVEPGRSSRNATRQSVNQLRELNPNFLGAVVNKVDTRQSGYDYYYYYGYGAYRSYYGDDDESAGQPLAG